MKNILEKYGKLVTEAEETQLTPSDVENEAYTLLGKIKTFLQKAKPHISGDQQAILKGAATVLASLLNIEDTKPVEEDVKMDVKTYTDMPDQDIKKITDKGNENSITLTESEGSVKPTQFYQPQGSQKYNVTVNFSKFYANDKKQVFDFFSNMETKWDLGIKVTDIDGQGDSQINETYTKNQVMALISAKKKGYIVEGIEVI